MVSRRKISAKQTLLFTGGFLLLSFLFPIILEYRNLRIESGSESIVSLLLNAQYNIIGDDPSNILNTLKLGLGAVLFRITGVDLLIALNGFDAQPLFSSSWPILASPRGLAGYITMDIFGFSQDAIHSMAPGLIGWFYLVGGKYFTVTGIVLFTILIYIFWRFMSIIGLKSLPVAQALFMAQMTPIIVDGTLDSIFALPTLALPASIAVCECMIRFNKVKFISCRQG
jgi:hypothetical protein